MAALAKNIFVVLVFSSGFSAIKPRCHQSEEASRQLFVSMKDALCN